MSRQLKNLELGIDSSLSYCSITLFKNKKIFWDDFKKNDFGHEQNLSVMLQKMLNETRTYWYRRKKLRTKQCTV